MTTPRLTQGAFACAMIFALTALPTSNAVAQLSEAARAFDAGNQHYAEGAYQKALATYERALENGYTGGALYYNMGNAYYRLDELGRSGAKRAAPNWL